MDTLHSIHRAANGHVLIILVVNEPDNAAREYRLANQQPCKHLRNAGRAKQCTHKNRAWHLAYRFTNMNKARLPSLTRPDHARFHPNKAWGWRVKSALTWRWRHVSNTSAISLGCTAQMPMHRYPAIILQPLKNMLPRSVTAIRQRLCTRLPTQIVLTRLKQQRSRDHQLMP